MRSKDFVQPLRFSPYLHSLKFFACFYKNRGLCASLRRFQMEVGIKLPGRGANSLDGKLEGPGEKLPFLGSKKSRGRVSNNLFAPFIHICADLLADFTSTIVRPPNQRS